MANDFYDTLGVSRQASEKEIRQAYRRLARQYHPDVNPGNAEAEARFKEINAAFEVLSDTSKRRKYDRYGDQWMHADEIEAMRQRGGRGGGMGGRGAGQPAGAGREFEFGDAADLNEMFGGASFGGIFDMFRRGGGRGGRAAGHDIEHAVEISLDEAYHGTSRTLELVDDGGERCSVCGGAGQVAGAVCHACRGSGRSSVTRRIEVQIPAGVNTDTRIRLAGKGAPGSGGGPAGDLYLKVTVRPHPRFERHGDDLHVTVDVPVADAALGGEVRVPTLKGKALALRVPPGTQPGRVFRLSGQGMPRRGGGFGDLLVRVRLVLPEPLTEEQRALFEALRRTTGGATYGAPNGTTTGATAGASASASGGAAAGAGAGDGEDRS